MNEINKQFSLFQGIAAVLLLLLALLNPGCGQADGNGLPAGQEEEIKRSGEKVIAVGSKDFTEQVLLAQISILLLQDAGFETVDRTAMGETEHLREALQDGEIDLYWEYTGTAWSVIFEENSIEGGPREYYEAVRERDLADGFTWLDYTPFNNTYTILMRRADAEKLALSTIGELSEVINSGERPLGRWVLAADYEYFTRADGYLGLAESYGFQFDEVLVTGAGDAYTALHEGEVTAAAGFATDSRVATLDLVGLADDMNHHPAYNCAPVVRTELLEQYPEIAAILNGVSAQLDDQTMSSLNAAVDIDGKEPAEAARQWLQSVGLL